MAFPWLYSENFEAGTRGNFDAASATAPDVFHYTTLARFRQAPFRGAYAMRVLTDASTTNRFFREDTGFDTAAAGTIFFRWYFYLGKDLLMADADRFSMVELESVLDTTTEVAAGIQRSGSNIQFWFGETQAAGTIRTFTLGTTTTALGQWYHAEVKALIDSGVPNDGTIDAWIDDASAGAQITALDQGAIVDAKFGVIGPEVGTTGTVLLDQILASSTRIFKDLERYPAQNSWIYDVQDHPIIGPGRFSAAVTGTGTNAVLNIYDTDGVPNSLRPLVVLRNVSANEFIPGHDLFDVNHGLYVTTSGTNVQAFISIDRGGLPSEGAVITRGLKQGVPQP